MINVADFGTAAFEMGGAYFTWRNAFQLYKDRKVSGVYWPTTVFFTLWGYWNVYLYWAIDFSWAWWAGIILMLGNTLWVVFYFLFCWGKNDG